MDTNGNGTGLGGAHLFNRRDPSVSVSDTASLLKFIANNQQYLIPPWGLSRFGWGGRPRPAVSLDQEFGYPDQGEIDANWYKTAYSRWGIATRVINVWPDECWAVYPDIYDSEAPGRTPWDEAWADLLEQTQLLHYLHRVDRLSRVGQFGVLFLGLDDGGRLDRAPAGINPDTGQLMNPNKKPKYKLNFVRAYDQTLVRVSSSEKDKHNRRYGQPKTYYIQFSQGAISGPSGMSDPNQKGQSFVENRVHWTRVVHVFDNRQTSEIYGVPALLPVANLLHDIRKVSGSAAEMFFKGGFPGYSFKTNPDIAAGDTDIDFEALAEQMHLYQNRLQRFLATVGGEWQSLQPQVANPDKHLEWFIKQVCMTIDVPMRIFMGSEAGHMASMKDDDAWRTRCGGRQMRYLDPWVIDPVLQRLTLYGALPPPKNKRLTKRWKDLRALSEKERTDVALKKAQTLMQFFSSNCDQKFATRLFLTMIFGLTEEEADAAEAELKKNPPPEPMEMKLAKMDAANKQAMAKQKSMGGTRKGNTPKAPAGRPSGGTQGSKPASKPGSAGKRQAVHNSRLA